MKALVLGRGVSGKGAGELLRELGFRVNYYCDGDSVEKFDFSFAVKSPGFPPNHRIVLELKRRRIKVYGEIELAYRFMRGRIIGITGTNGKSTTTALVYEGLRRTKDEVFIGGNFGVPASSFALRTTPASTTVLELSSFQIEDLTSFSGDVGAIINVTPDHLDRYASLKDYVKAKLKMIEHFTYNVVNGDDEELKGVKGEGIVRFSLKGNGDFFIDRDGNLRGEGMRIPSSDLPLKGVHNLENYLCAASVLRLLRVSEDKIFEAFMSFKGLPHRSEEVLTLCGVKFINDSKSTNVDSLKKALLSYSNVVLIAGGKDKGLDFSFLRPIIKDRVKAIVGIGESGPKFKECFSDIVPVELASSMDEAVRMAFSLSKPGCVVLLSPGCSSFDMFLNYKERGEAFKRAVKRLEEEIA